MLFFFVSYYHSFLDISFHAVFLCVSTGIYLLRSNFENFDSVQLNTPIMSLYKSRNLLNQHLVMASQMRKKTLIT